MPQPALAEAPRVRPPLVPAPVPDLNPEPAPVSSASHGSRRVSEEEYWCEYYLDSDVHYEWNHGRLEEKPVSDYETITVYQWFMALLSHFLRVHPIAKLEALEMGFRLPLPTGTVIRKPDLGVVRHDNPQPLLPLDCSYHGVFDLCVEALSDQERRGVERDTLVKKAEYAAGGVPEYYILHREPECLAFFTRAASGLYVPIEPQDGVICSRVLPGFRFRLADLVRQPEHETLRADPVYADFVLPGWRAAEERADAEAQRADAAAERADAEAQRAVAEAQARQAAERRAAEEGCARQAAEQRAAAEIQARLVVEQEARAAREALARLQAQVAGRAGEG